MDTLPPKPPHFPSVKTEPTLAQEPVQVALLLPPKPVAFPSTDEHDNDIKPSIASPPVSHSPVLSADVEFSDVKTESPVPTSASLPPAASRKAAKGAKLAKEEVKIPLIDHLPEAGEEARQTFVTLPGNVHQYKSLGRSNQDEESMICDCVYKHDHDERHLACGASSDCINRLTQVECLQDECKTKQYCLNQRFTRKEYSNIEVVLTERKGYGLRAGSNIENDAFIYEYIGEVVQQATFMKRMQSYAKEGIRHFYFMMLQREEYIDATKKGDIARFANHSCNPNCYVAKWIVGKRMRMGIFAKRDILKGEELTFNYNVDRYGHDAQPCYCDEPNCVGSIGGKTQTDIGGMDELYLDALGITDEVEALGLKGTKKKKGKKLGEDFMPILKPVDEKEVPKVIAAVRQSTANRTMMCKLLGRVTMTTDQVVQRRILRMHGFSLMHSVLKEFPEDKEVVKLALETMSQWHLLNRNKVEDSKIEEVVAKYVEDEDESLRPLAQNLMQTWAGLETAYRIARRPARIPDAEDDAPESTAPAEPEVERPPTPPLPKPVSLFASNAVFTRPEASIPTPIISLPSSSDAAIAAILRGGGEPYRPLPSMRRPPLPAPLPPPAAPQPGQSRDRLEAILARTAQVAAEKRVKELEAAAAAREAEHLAHLEAERRAAKRAAAKASGPDSDRQREREKRKRSSLGGGSTSSGLPSSTSKAGTSEEQKEKRLLKMVGEVVVKSMSKYKDQLDHDRFKKYAKECANLIAAKEKKSQSYIIATTLPSLSEEKQAKMKKFTKEFVHKVLNRLRKENGRSSSRSNPDDKGKARDPRQMRISLGGLGDGSSGGTGSPMTPAATDGSTGSREGSLLPDDGEGGLFDDVEYGGDDDDVQMAGSGDDEDAGGSKGASVKGSVNGDRAVSRILHVGDGSIEGEATEGLQHLLTTLQQSSSGDSTPAS